MTKRWNERQLRRISFDICHSSFVILYTSRLRTFSALSSMNCRRGSTTSPIRLVNILSASTALSRSDRLCSSLRFSGFIVVSNNSLAFISPRPLKRLICTPRRPISKILCRISGMEKSGCETALVAFAFDQFKDRPIARGIVVHFQPFAARARR